METGQVEKQATMAANLLAFIQFDDNTPRGEPPFSCEPSVWSLEWDLGLYGCKDYRFIAAISGVRNESEKAPLFPLRGPPSSSVPSIKELKDEPLVGWLTYPEILASLDHLDVSVNELHSSVLNVLGALKLLKDKYGDERVRLLFAIRD
jgi:hypothetical protein